MNLKAVIILFCSTMCVFSFAQTKKSSSNKSKSSLPLFTINKKSVSTEEFIYLYKKNHQNASEDFTKEKIDEYLRLYVSFKLKVEEARKRGMDTTASFLKEYNQYKDELRKPYLPGNGLTDSLVQMTYNRMKEEVRAAHILISLTPDATPEDTVKAYNRILELRKKIVAADNFQHMAKEFSEDPSAKMNEGDLGYFTAMQMVYPFENAAYTTAVGKISQPVRTRFGYHLLQVIDRRPAQGEVEVSHIMIRTGEDKDKIQAKNTVFSVYDQLQAGMEWRDLCRSYSEDPGTKDNGGKLRPFGTGAMSNVPEFERVAFELQNEGQISDPFETQYGWHIIKLERKIPLAPFDEVAPSLKSRISRDERAQISQQLLQEKLKKEMSFTEHTGNKNKLFQQADTTLNAGSWKPVFTNASGETLFSLKKKNFTVQDFIAYVNKQNTPVTTTSQKYLADQYTNFVDVSILQLKEANMLAENPEYGYLLAEYYEGILLFEIMEKEIWNKASEDSVGQARYFESNKSKYKADDRVKAVFYSADNGSVLSPLRSLISDDDQKKLQEYTAKNKIKTEAGYFEKKEKAILQNIPWEKGLHTAQNNEKFYLAWLKEVLPAGEQSFEEARPSVVSDYQTYLETQWLDQLRKKYPVKLNAKGKKYIYQKLQQR